MVFDQLCGIVERQIPQLKKYVENAKIFLFPSRAHEVLPKSISSDRIDFNKKYFFLPFRTIAIEDKTSVIILHDIFNDAKGLNVDREFVECLPLDRMSDDFGDSDTIPEDYRLMFDNSAKYMKDYYLVTKGVISIIDCEESSYVSYGSVHAAVFCTKNKIYADGKSLLKNAGLVRSVLRNITTALEEVMYFNSPDKFIVEVFGTKSKKHHKGAKIARSDNRSKFIIMHPNEIKHKFKIEDAKCESTRNLTPHPRRRHFRTYEDDRFVYMKGKTVIIPATWVGSVEAVIGSKRYKIRLDI